MEKRSSQIFYEKPKNNFLPIDDAAGGIRTRAAGFSRVSWEA
jgi:hypothetical protein